MAISFNLNGSAVSVQSEPDTPLLWVIRDEIGLTGTKFGCGKAQCGSCTVHVNGSAVRACQTPVSSVSGKKVATVESLSADNSHPLQKAWIKHQVPQCGYCQSGQLSAESDSTVATFLPETEDTGVWHARTAEPLTCTVHEPHCALPQPNLVPVRPISSRITHSRGVSGSDWTETAEPFRLKLIAMVLLSSFWFYCNLSQ